jgi:hypothetical protein
MSTTRMKVLGKAALLALPFLMLAQGALATPGDLKLTKIALHLVPGIPATESCSQVIPSRCADTPVYDAGFQVLGAANTWYTLYILATDINTSVGLKRVSFKIECDPGVYVLEWLDPPQWCANTTLVPEWLDCGTTIDIEFPTCVGTNPDPADPEGDGTVLLGVCLISGSGKLAIGSLDTNERTAQVINCAGETTELTWTAYVNGMGLVSLGEIGLGSSFYDGNIYGTCTFPGMFDNPCAAGWSSSMMACCYPGVGCAGGLSQISERACDYVGGVWSVVRCSWACTDADCQALPVPVRLTTWGAIKSMYD